ncbi:hypothetical protein VCHC72A2_00648A, partial [Vibrio cholerae HC-72A2]
MLISLQ